MKDLVRIDRDGTETLLQPPAMATVTPVEWKRFFAHGPLGRRGMQVIALREGNLHGCAALCLYEDPRGFTAADIALLRQFDDGLGRGNPDETPEGTLEERVFPDDIRLTGQDWLRLRSLIARIAALLPPL